MCLDEFLQDLDDPAKVVVGIDFEMLKKTTQSYDL